MNKLLLIVFLSFTIFNCSAQLSNTSRIKQIPVRVSDWGKKSMAFADEFWDDSKKAEIIQQIGEDEYLKVINNCDYRTQLPQLSGFIGRKNGPEFYEKLGLLKVYQIAVFSHIYEGKDWGKYVILCVPYEENKNWDPSLKWQSAYFIVEKSVVENIN